MLIYGHRGHSATEPENTLRAFAQALTAGVDGIELDVQTTADGIPVIMHDRDVSRTTNGSGKISELTFAELRELDAGSGEKVPTLDEVLALIGTQAEVDIEFKQADIEQAVLAILDDHPSVRWFASSFNWDILRTLRTLKPNAALWPLSSEVTDDLFAIAAEIGAPGVAIAHGALTSESVSRLKSVNLAIFAWTVNDIDEAQRIQQLGIEKLCTDDPSKIIAGLH